MAKGRQLRYNNFDGFKGHLHYCRLAWWRVCPALRLQNLVHHLWVWPGFIPCSVQTVGHRTSSVKTGFHRNAVGLRRKKDGCILSVEAHWESSYIDTGQNKLSIKCPTILIA